MYNNSSVQDATSERPEDQCFTQERPSSADEWTCRYPLSAEAIERLKDIPNPWAQPENPLHTFKLKPGEEGSMAEAGRKMYESGLRWPSDRLFGLCGLAEAWLRHPMPEPKLEPELEPMTEDELSQLYDTDEWEVSAEMQAAWDA